MLGVAIAQYFKAAYSKLYRKKWQAGVLSRNTNHLEVFECLTPEVLAR